MLDFCGSVGLEFVVGVLFHEIGLEIVLELLFEFHGPFRDVFDVVCC